MKFHAMPLRHAFIFSLLGVFAHAAPASANSCSNVYVIGSFDESGLRESPGGELTQQLVAFYAVLRKRLMQAQAKQSAELLEEEMARVLRLRGNWQQVELGRVEARPEAVQVTVSPASMSNEPADRRSEIVGWSA